MVGYPFQVTGRDEVRYAVGNPMGFYSSWASFAVAHHFCMFLAAKQCHQSFRLAKYAILGDDVIIGDHNLAREYQSILSTLGVEISATKTHVSKDTFEFAKRWFHKGVEISPFPVAGLRNVVKRYNLFIHYLISLERMGWNPLVSTVNSSILYLQSVRKISREKFLEDLTSKSRLCEVMIRFITAPSEEGAKIFLKDFACLQGRDCPELSGYESLSVVQNAVVQAFAKSNKTDSDKHSLGWLATVCVQYLSGIPEL